VRLLLDTHALLWWLADDRRLGPGARQLIADPSTEVLVSWVSLWEIVVKKRTGKLQADLPELAQAIGNAGFTMLAIGWAHLDDLLMLPMPHREPFDHLLAAQARVEEALFVSQDSRLASYPVRRMLCSD